MVLSTNRGIVILSGICAQILIAAIFLWRVEPYIENQLERESSRSLQEANLFWAKIEADGRDLNVTGVAPSPSLKQQAQRIIESVPGVRIVRNQLLVANDKPATLAPEEQARRSRDLLADTANNAPVFASDPPVDNINLEPIEPGFNGQMTNAIDQSPGHNIAVATAAQSKPPIPTTTAQAQVSDITRTIDSTECAYRLQAELSQQAISFATGSSDIDQDSLELMQNLVRVAKRCPQAVLEIGGHTDDLGSRDNNLTLSQQRAESVMEYLVRNGVSLSRLRAVGYGEGRPLVENTTAERRKMNRRIEFSLVDEI